MKGPIIPYLGGRNRKIPSSRSAWESLAQSVNIHPSSLPWGSFNWQAVSQSQVVAAFTEDNSKDLKKDRQEPDMRPDILVSPSSVAPLGR